MPERRKEHRADSSDRRSFPRPPLWLNLALLLIAVLGAGAAKLHRNQLDREYDALLRQNDSAPAEMARLRSELAELNLTREATARELDARLKYIESQRSEGFYLAIDTARKKFSLHYGENVVREADVQIGSPEILKSPSGREWTFVPLKGTLMVRDKLEGSSWQIPEWVYLLNRQNPPGERPTVPNGLGRYVIQLSNGYLIHSPPSPDSPLKGPKPGSFMVPEEDLRAIWPRISDKTRVFVF